MSETGSIISSTQDAAAAIAAARESQATDEAVDENAGIAEEASQDQNLTAEGADAEPEETPASGDHEEAGEPEEAPVLAAPNTWPKDRLEEWDELTPAAQEVVLAREAEVHSALSEKGRETAEATRKAEEAANRIQTEYTDRIEKLNEMLPQLAENFKSKWEAVDWVALADEMDSNEFNKLKEQRIKEETQLQTAAAEAQQANAKAQAEFQANQHKALLDRNPQYAGDAGKKLLADEAQKVEQFALNQEGVTPDQLKQITAPLYEVLRDAMRYRAAAKTATKPAKQPAQKVAKPGARRSSGEVSKKNQSDAKANLKALAKQGAGRNAQDRALADAIAAKRRTG